MEPQKSVTLDSLEAPLALCSEGGVVYACTGEALTLFQRLGLFSALPAQLPGELWSMLEEAPNGCAVEWQPETAVRELLGCTRYPAEGNYLLLMKEVSQQQMALSKRLHRQRLEAIGRLVASVAHELRNSVASIAYCIDYLSLSSADEPSDGADVLAEISSASSRLEATVDGLLDYARLGPSVSAPVSLRDVLTRSQGFLRSYYRTGAHRLVVDIPSELDLVRGNSLTVEQVFVNLLLNSAQASDTPLTVQVRASVAEPYQLVSLGIAPPMLRVRVQDDGPGIPDRHRSSIFRPFFTTRDEGTGLGLATAKEAVESLGGAIALDASPDGTCFSVYLKQVME